MRRSNPKFSFDPGFSVTMKILSLVVLGCVLVFFGSVYAVDPNNPLGEHPWDDSKPKIEPQSPKFVDRCDVIIIPCVDFGGWTIIHFSQVQDGDKDRVQIQTSSKNQDRFFIFF